MAIDVLAMMDAAVARLPDSEAAPLDEARAAVAELIEADKEYDTARSRYDHAFRDGSNGDFSEQREALAVLREAKKRRAAALARVQGEGA